jgi:hypothetical protein
MNKTLVKHVHMLAPTGKYAHRNDPHEPAGCPACDCESETNDHLFQCQAKSRQDWQQSTIRMLSRDIGDPLVDPTLNMILIDGVSSIFQSANGQLNKIKYPQVYHKLIEDQNKVGWSHIFRCRWVKEWRRQYTRWATATCLSRPSLEAQKWLESKGKLILSQWWVLWKIRNAERHRRDDAQFTLNLRLVVESKLEELYSKRTQMMRIDHDIFPYSNAQEHIANETSIPAIHDWCLDNGPAIQASCTQAQRLGVAGTGDIRSYFPPAT